jgi:hypothetical protein
MRPGVRVALGTGVAVGMLVFLGALTRFGYVAEPANEAELRLAWRARAPLVEECRRLTDAEREALPVHMRRDVVCEGRVASYRLRVEVDGVVRRESVVKGAGARGDRPLYVFEALRLTPGERGVRVVFERVGDAGGDANGDGNGNGAIPDRLELDTAVAFGPGNVVLVTYDPNARGLVLRGVPGRRE